MLFPLFFFFNLILFCDLGGEERAILFMEREGRAASKMPLLEHDSEKGVVKHLFPMNYFLKPWKLGQWVFQVIKFGIVQYVSMLFDLDLYSSGHKAELIFFLVIIMMQNILCR